MPALPTLVELFSAGVHFGHHVSKRYPKMQPYIFTVKNSIHIINLELTLVRLAEAFSFVSKTAAQGGTVLFVGTKQQAKPWVEKAAAACGMPWVTERWLGGTFTNFGEISRVIGRFSALKRQRDSGELEKYTKKERLEFDREIERLRLNVGGIERLKKNPDALFVIDVKHEKIAIAEAAKKGIPIVALCDTNVNPTAVTYVIPGNDDAIKSIELVCRLVAEAVNEGKAQAGQVSQAGEERLLGKSVGATAETPAVLQPQAAPPAVTPPGEEAPMVN